MIEVSLRDYFAANAPDAPVWFDRIKDSRPVRVRSDWTEIREVFEGPEAYMIRWRWHYADLMMKARTAKEDTSC